MVPDPVVQSANGAATDCAWPAVTGPNVSVVVVVDLEQLVSAGLCGTTIVRCAVCPLFCSVATTRWELPTDQLVSILIVASNDPSLRTETFAPDEGSDAV